MRNYRAVIPFKRHKCIGGHAVQTAAVRSRHNIWGEGRGFRAGNPHGTCSGIPRKSPVAERTRPKKNGSVIARQTFVLRFFSPSPPGLNLGFRVPARTRSSSDKYYFIRPRTVFNIYTRLRVYSYGPNVLRKKKKKKHVKQTRRLPRFGVRALEVRLHKPTQYTTNDWKKKKIIF